METLESIKIKIITEIENTPHTSEDFEKLTNSLKNIIDAERSQVQTINERAIVKNETLKFIVSVFAPLLTAIGLIWAIFYQTQQAQLQAKQFKESTQLQVSNSEDSKWKDFVSQVTDQQKLTNNVAAPILIRSFLKSPKYSDQAHELAIVLLARISNYRFFQSIFSYVDSTITWKNFQDLTFISKNLTDIRTEEITRKNQFNALLDSHNLKNEDEIRILRDRTADEVHEIQLELNIVSDKIMSFLKKTANPHSSTIFNLTSVSFFETDLSEINFTFSTLDNTSFESCNLKDANFEKVNSWNNVGFDGSNWWQAKSIDKNLLLYLNDYYPFDSRNDYKYKDASDEVAFKKWKSKCEEIRKKGS